MKTGEKGLNFTQIGKKTLLPADKSTFPLKARHRNPNWSHRLQRQPDPGSNPGSG